MGRVGRVGVRKHEKRERWEGIVIGDLVTK